MEKSASPCSPYHSADEDFAGEGDPNYDDEQMARFEKTAWRKLDVSILGILTLMYLLSWLDRTNLGNARIAGLQDDLNLSNKQYSIALTVTFVPYVLVELPANLLLKASESYLYPDVYSPISLKVVGPNILLPLMLTLWGIVTTLQGTVHDYTGLLVCRFFLGLLEGGLLPAIVFYLSFFYPRSRLQKRLSVVFSATSLAGAFSGLLAAGITQMDGIGGRPGWAWIFILEGLFTVVVGLLSFLLVPQSPMHCSLLNKKERDYIAQRLSEDGAISKDDAHDRFRWHEVGKTFKLPQVWFLLIGAAFNGVILYSLSYFAPSIVQGLGFRANQAQLMSVPPYAVAFVLTNIGSYIADRYQCRGLIFMFCAACCTAGFAMFLGSHRASVQYASMFLTISGINALAPAFTTWVANNAAPHTRRATAIAAVVMANNAGGILSTWLLGSLSAPPRYTMGTIVLLVCSVGLGVSSGINVAYLWYQNEKKAKIRANSTKEGEPEGLGDQSAWFIYIL